MTGEEHYVNWSYVNDDKILDPDYPESLVYRLEAGGRKALVAAMFMLPENSTLDTVPDVGGKLTQWHVHNYLCFTPDPVAPRLAGFVGVDQPCGAPLVKRGALPMIHVWIVPHRCGPFAAQEGIRRPGQAGRGAPVRPRSRRLVRRAAPGCRLRAPACFPRRSGRARMPAPKQVLRRDGGQPS